MTKDAHFVSTNGGKTGRSSHFFFDSGKAKEIADIQNKRAVDLGIKTRYEVATISEKEVTLPDKIRS